MTGFRRDKERDFFYRTLTNLARYNCDHQEDPQYYPYEVTMLLNSLFGILIVPKENLEILDSVNIEFLQSKYRGDAKNFFRHMRNSLSHGHFINGIMIDSETKEIVSIRFQDIDKKIMEI